MAKGDLAAIAWRGEDDRVVVVEDCVRCETEKNIGESRLRAQAGNA